MQQEALAALRGRFIKWQKHAWWDSNKTLQPITRCELESPCLPSCLRAER
jgi:hypothetical protein